MTIQSPYRHAVHTWVIKVCILVFVLTKSEAWGKCHLTVSCGGKVTVADLVFFSYWLVAAWHIIPDQTSAFCCFVVSATQKITNRSKGLGQATESWHYYSINHSSGLVNPSWSARTSLCRLCQIWALQCVEQKLLRFETCKQFSIHR